MYIIHRPVFYLKHDVSETGFCLRFQVEPTQFGPKDTAVLRLWSGDGEGGILYILNTTAYDSPEDGDRIQCVVFVIKERTMDNVQNCDSYIHIPSSQTYNSYITVSLIYVSQSYYTIFILYHLVVDKQSSNLSPERRQVTLISISNFKAVVSVIDGWMR
jgi:hypothetical protein